MDSEVSCMCFGTCHATSVLRRSLVDRMLVHAIKEPRHRHVAVLFLVAYSFLLRVPSEALPMVAAKPDNVPDVQSALFLEGDSLTLKLRSRKNKRSGSTLVRYCTCKVCCMTRDYEKHVCMLTGKQAHMRCPHSRTCSG